MKGGFLFCDALGYSKPINHGSTKPHPKTMLICEPFYSFSNSDNIKSNQVFQLSIS